LNHICRYYDSFSAIFDTVCFLSALARKYPCQHEAVNLVLSLIILYSTNIRSTTVEYLFHCKVETY